MRTGLGSRIVLRSFLIAGFVAISTSLLARSAAESVDVIRALDLYEQGHAGIFDALDRLPPNSGRPMLGDLRKRGPKWVSSKGPAQVNRRRLVLASFALEAARGIRAQGGPLDVDLIEWACDQLRYTKTPLPGERWWHLGAIHLLEEGGSHRALEYHLLHARLRIKDEPRISLAHAFWNQIDADAAPGELSMMRATELNWIRDPGLDGPPALRERINLFNAGILENGNTPRPFGNFSGAVSRPAVFGVIPTTQFEFGGRPSIWKSPDRFITLWRSVRRDYERLLAIPGIAPEARLRLGYLRLVSGKPAEARQQCATVLSETDRADLRYLAQLFSGRASEHLHRLADAEASYRGATETIPTGRTAHMWLATVLLAEGRVDNAQRESELSLSIPAGAEDPWKTFGEGDLLPWSTVIASLRQSLR